VNELIFTYGGFFVEKNYLWFVPYDYDFICKYNLEEKKIEEIRFLEESTFIDSTTNTVKFQDYIITVPADSDMLHAYEEKSGTVSDYKLQYNISHRKYLCTANYQGNLYLFPLGNDHIIKINGEKGIDISYIKSPEKEFISSAQIENNVYLVANSNKLYCYDLLTNKLLSVTVDTQKISCVAVRNKNEICFADADGNVYLYYISDGVIERTEIKVEQCSSIAYVNNRLFAFPMSNPDGFYIIDGAFHSVKFVDVCGLHKNSQNNSIMQAFSQNCIVDDQIYVMNVHRECLFKIDSVTEEVTVYDIDLNSLSEECMEMVREKEGKKDVQVMYERNKGYSSLDSFIKRILNETDKTNAEIKLTGELL
jgi:hypothetical protein